MSTDPTRLRLSSQDFRLTFDLLATRQYRLADVDSSGADVAPAAPDPVVSVPRVLGYQGATTLGPISGNVGQGGFTMPLSIAEFPADWEPFYGVEVRCATVYGGIFGVVGAAGIDPGERGVVIFRGYQQSATTANAYGFPRVDFGLSTSHRFLERFGFGRGIDWGAGLDHSGPTTSNTILDHLIRYHTNLTPRSEFGIYLPDHLVNSYGVSGDKVMSILRGIANNFAAGEGMVYFRRGDDLYIGAHPGMIPDLHPNINNPILHITEDITLHGDNGEPGVTIPEEEGAQATSVQLVTTRSDQTTYTTPIYYAANDSGDHVRRECRTDDWEMANVLAQRLLVHLNRKYRNITVRMPLNIACDLGDVVLLSLDGSNNNRGLVWDAKKFFVQGIVYDTNLSEHEMTCTLTLDQIVDQVV
jgi:hypothetical protein